MVFRLVRIDTEEPCKIVLPSGKHLMGRGKLLECDDKRVSRKHGEIEVNNDAISIKALHQNPCFYIKKSSEEIVILKLNCVVSLYNGDKFGLLPNSYWYEIFHCTDLDLEEPQSTDEYSQNSNLDCERTTEIQTNQTIPAPNADTETNGTYDHDDEEKVKLQINESLSGSQVRDSESPLRIPARSPTLLQQLSPSLTVREITQSHIENTSSLTLQSAPQSESITESYSVDGPASEAVNSDSSPPKRYHNPEDSKKDIKKAKIEPPDVKQNSDARPGFSEDLGYASSPDPEATTFTI
ncbi:aprataxin and PNK-like factor isoform X2 [Pectinophora gossypiella]|nr:aprataxin and PNK-like factor isoform X2 [Pectinophora gossypiella]